MNKVFVYGTLKKRFHNHQRYMQAYNARFLGKYGTPPKYTMYDLGYFPGVVKGGDNPVSIQGEVYEVDDLLLAKLDNLEGHPDYYRRELVPLGKYGEGWIYLFEYKMDIYQNRTPRIIENGEWEF